MASIISNSVKRTITTSPNLFSSLGASATAGHGGGGSKMWRILSYVVALPAVGVCMVNAYLKHQEEHHEPPPFVAYEHLRIRNKRFPWGDGNKSLFHNPHVNALPDGYEESH